MYFLLAVAKGLFLSLFYTKLSLSRVLVSGMAILSSAHSSGYSIYTKFVRTSILTPSRELASARPIAHAVPVSSHFTRSAALVYAYASPFMWRAFFFSPRVSLRPYDARATISSPLFTWRAFISSPRLSFRPYEGRSTISLHRASCGEHLSTAHG